MLQLSTCDVYPLANNGIMSTYFDNSTLENSLIHEHIHFLVRQNLSIVHNAQPLN